jgi:hypothetical protein
MTRQPAKRLDTSLKINVMNCAMTLPEKSRGMQTHRALISAFLIYPGNAGTLVQATRLFSVCRARKQTDAANGRRLCDRRQGAPKPLETTYSGSCSVSVVWRSDENRAYTKCHGSFSVIHSFI